VHDGKDRRIVANAIRASSKTAVGRLTSLRAAALVWRLGLVSGIDETVRLEPPKRTLS
jgi:hypothetical protein